jgi:hypothetical protein
MNESNETKKSRNITFRLTKQQYDQIERAALAAGDEPNSWCRRIVLVQSTDGFGLTQNDRLIYEAIARVHYLVDNGFRMLLFQEPPAEALMHWSKITAETRSKIRADRR